MFAFGLLMFSRSFALFVLALLCFFALYGLVPAPRTRAVANRLFVVFVAVAICSYGAAAAYAMATQGIVLGAARHVLLLNGLRALGDSLGFGFGPGAFSGLHQPFEGMEVHNLFVDLALSGGMAGVLVMVVVFVLSARATMRLPQKRWLCVWGGMLIMVMLHNLLRHPIFWTALFCPLLQGGWGARVATDPATAGRA